MLYVRFLFNPGQMCRNRRACKFSLISVDVKRSFLLNSPRIFYRLYDVTV